MILIDSNVLIDIATRDPQWFEWSRSALEDAADRHELCINPIIYAEVSIRYASQADFDEVFPPMDFRRLPLPSSAAFLAAKAHSAYRRRGGRRTSTLPDFFIGAHALVAGCSLLTRDPRRIRQYFSSVDLIAP
jgi:predicted nucleic acid-binding protein